MKRILPIAGLFFALLASSCAPETHRSGRSDDRELENIRAFLAAAGPSRVEWAINIDNPAPYKKEYDFAAQTGKFRFVRMWFWWRWLEPEKGKINWAIMDEQVAWARRNGMEILATFAGIPAWANGTSPDCDFWHRGDCQFPPHDPNAFPDFVTKAARRYGKDIRHWSMWNEPNLPAFFSGTRNEFIGLIQEPGIRALRAVDPAAIVVGPDLAQLKPSWLREILGDGYWDYRDWARDLFRYNGGASYDVISEHMYRNRAGEVGAGFDEFHDIMVRERVGNKPVWVTEVGFNAATIGERQQAIETANLMTEAEKRSWIDRVYYFDISDGDKSDPTNHLALLNERPGLEPRTAFWLLTARLPEPPLPDPYEANDPRLVADFLARMRSKVALDQAWDPSWDGRLNWHEWNYYYQQLTLGGGPDFDSLFKFEGKSTSERSTLDEWWAAAGDAVRLFDEPIQRAVPEVHSLNFRADVSNPARAWFELYGKDMIAAPGEKPEVHVNCGRLRVLSPPEFVEPLINSSGQSQLNFFLTPGAERARCLVRVYFVKSEATGQTGWRSTELSDAQAWFELPAASEL